MQITYYQDNYFYYFRKPAGIPSTFGKQKCFLDFLLESKNTEIQNILSRQKEMFSAQDEYGLVNRLDNDTTGLLYFAKTLLIKQRYKQAQSEGEIQKYYLADVYGKYLPETQNISSPIGHHKLSNDRMVVILDPTQTDKIKGKRLHHVNTHVEKLYYDENKNITTLLVKISKGIRHQIRAHLSSIGFPIVGEKIYIKNKKKEQLQLFSIGLKQFLTKN